MRLIMPPAPGNIRRANEAKTTQYVHAALARRAAGRAAFPLFDACFPPLHLTRFGGVGYNANAARGAARKKADVQNTANTEPAQNYDILIRGGTVFDGTGAAGVRADIGIRGDKIAFAGNLDGVTAGRVIDANGLHVAPGFIDIHTHSDISAVYDTGQGSAVGMGVTTQVVGNCGLSPGFATPASVFEFEKRWLAPHGARIRWNTYAEFLQQIEEAGFATNFYPLAGHGTLRKRVMGMEERPPSAEDMTAMQRELAAAMEAGCWGLSSGLEYPPSSYADETELAELCKIVADAGGFYATHLRNEGDTLAEAVQEALNVAARAELPLQLSHHKAEGRANWGKVQTTLGMVSAARAWGMDVQLDQYPYTAFMTGLSIQILPRWALSGTPEETQARLTDPAVRAAILAELRTAHPEWNDFGENAPWRSIQIGIHRSRPELAGRTIESLAQEANQNPLEYVLELLAEAEGFIAAIHFAIGEADIAAVMQHDFTSIGSDGVGTHPGGTAGDDRIHPRAYGTFPRVLGRYVRELGILTEAQAIYKMTGLPAARLKLTDRGRIAPGKFADITIYDPRHIDDCATFDAPHQYPVGIGMVLVNGRIAWERGAPTDVRAGSVLRRN